MKKIVALLGVIILTIAILLWWKKPLETKQMEEKNPYEEKGYSSNVIEKIEHLNSENKSYLLEEDYLDNLESYLQNENFEEAHLKDYIEHSKTYGLSLEDTIFVVNHGYKSDTYNEEILALMHSEYYIHEYLNRYLNYQKKDSDSVVREVNSNLDYAFYTKDYAVDFKNPYLILVNKYYRLSSDYVPNNLVTIESKHGVALQLESTVYEQYKVMYEAAKKEGLSLYIRSPYRSYATQNRIYNNYVASDGQAEADTYSARPGYSEHQTGLAFDVTTPTTTLSTFQYTQEFVWMQEHAHEYGFILRYPKGKEYITGYVYEPWHYRYVGTEIATKIKETGLTYEEYYAYYLR